MHGGLFRLALDLAIRDLEARYKRSMVGWVWLFLTPVVLIGIYWMVFSVVLQVTWEHPITKEKAGYVFPFVAGLLFYIFFTDALVSSTTLFVSKRTFVIKSAFPIWVLWLANIIRAATHASTTLIILLIIVFTKQPLSSAAIIWSLVALFNGLLFTCAVSLLFSCLGPFIGDMTEVNQLALRVLFYVSPIAYPLDKVPENVRVFLWFNPLTYIVEPLRNAVVFAEPPEPIRMIFFSLFSFLLLSLAIWVFRRTKGVIADVV
jgi:lipopolysaccharide transport system permease protein